MPEPDKTVFDMILAGDIPSHKVFEDEHVYSFLDINPIAVGHTLVIPKQRAAYVHEMSDDSAAAVGRALPRIARAVLAATGAEHYNILQNNGAPAHQSVFHVHFHIIPKLGPDLGLGLKWPMSPLEAGEAAHLLEKMHAALGAEA